MQFLSKVSSARLKDVKQLLTKIASSLSTETFFEKRLSSDNEESISVLQILKNTLIFNFQIKISKALPLLKERQQPGYLVTYGVPQEVAQNFPRPKLIYI